MNDGYVRYWMSCREGTGMLIVQRQPLGRIVGGCPLFITHWRGKTLREFFRWHAKRGGCEYEELEDPREEQP